MGCCAIRGAMLRLINRALVPMAASTVGQGWSGAAGLNSVLHTLEVNGRLNLLEGLDYGEIGRFFEQAATHESFSKIIAEKNLFSVIRDLKNFKDSVRNLLHIIQEIGDDDIPSSVARAMWEHLQQHLAADSHLVDLKRQLGDIVAGSFVLRTTRRVTYAEQARLRTLESDELRGIVEAGDLEIGKAALKILSQKANDGDETAKKVLIRISFENFVEQIRKKMERGKRCQDEMRLLAELGWGGYPLAVFALDEAAPNDNGYHLAADLLLRKLVSNHEAPPQIRAYALKRLLRRETEEDSSVICDLDIQRAIHEMIAYGAPSIQLSVFNAVKGLPGDRPTSILEKALEAAVEHERALSIERSSTSYREMPETRWAAITEMKKRLDKS